MKKGANGENGPDLSGLQPVAKLVNRSEVPVWRVGWNICGNTLSTAAADGAVRMWRRNYMGSWICITEFGQPGEGQGEGEGEGERWKGQTVRTVDQYKSI